MAINTEVSVSKIQSQVYKRFVNLSVNEEAMVQGEGTIRISPFDDYILFTLYDEIDNSNKPIDLSNVGKLFLSFIGENDTIRIEYYTNVQELDLSQGQVLFRISASDSKKILSLDNNNFYVSSQMVSETGDLSDESIMYTGTFLSFAEDSQATLTSKYNDLLDTSSAEVATLQEEAAQLNNEVDSSFVTIGSLQQQIIDLTASNKELTNVLAELNSEVESSVAEAALANAEAAQANTALTESQQQFSNSVSQENVNLDIFSKITSMAKNFI